MRNIYSKLLSVLSMASWRRSSSNFSQGAKAKTFTISILAFNRLDTTKRCLDAVFANSSDFHLILTNNASTDGTKEYFDQVARTNDATVFHETENTGYIAPNNRAFELAKLRGSPYFVALNNDTEPPPKWLEKLARPLNRNKRAALSGPIGGCCTLQPDLHGYRGDRLEYLEGSCLCVKVEAVSPLGPLYSDYLDFAYGEDSDLSLRVREKGYTIHRVPFDARHRGGDTTKSSPELQARCVASEERNLKIMMKRWAHYLKVRKFDYPIIVKRKRALGDVLLTIPLIRAIRESYPLSRVMVQTDYPALFSANPDITVRGWDSIISADALVVELDGAYENRPQLHYVEAYEMAARDVLPGLRKVDLVTELKIDRKALAKSVRRRRTICQPQQKLCLINAGPTGWPGRDWDSRKFGELTEWLVSNGWHVAAVGNTKNPVAIKNCIDLVGKTSIHELIALLSLSQLFVGIDSFPMHCAQAVGCPTIGIFGVTDARYVMTKGSHCIGVNANPLIPCAGLRHKQTGKSMVSCSPECIDSVTVAQVIKAISTITAYYGLFSSFPKKAGIC